MAEILSKSYLISPSYCSSHLYSVSSASLKDPSSSSSSLKLQPLKSSLGSEFHGLKVSHNYQFERQKPSKGNLQAFPMQMSLCIGKAQKWWQKGIQPNMKEITCAQDLVDSLLKAGDKLVIVDFFSPGCGGCKALHPKICQFAEMNPDVQFIQVNYEDHKSMSYSLNVHVLPFFRFYRGAHGRLCSFSCTNATIKKFKDALAKHTTERCSLGPTKGLEESELLALAGNKDLSFNYTPKPRPIEEPVPTLTQGLGLKPESNPVPASNMKLPLPSTSQVLIKDSEEKTLISSGR